MAIRVIFMSIWKETLQFEYNKHKHTSVWRQNYKITKLKKGINMSERRKWQRILPTKSDEAVVEHVTYSELILHFANNGVNLVIESSKSSKPVLISWL